MADAPHAWRFEAIGVPWEIETAAPLDEGTRQAIRARIEAYDLAWSRFRGDSLVSRIARAEDGVALPEPEATELLGLYAALAAATGGRVDPRVGPRLTALGYGTGDAIDVGAAGKGQLIDLVAEVLRSHGVTEFVVDASGDILRCGPTIRVALEHPGDPTRAVGVAEIADGAICASATNRRRWVDLDGRTVHHVIDALTGTPIDGIVATWATAPTTMVADGVATALFFTSAIPAELRAEWVRITASGRIEVSDGFPGEVFA